MLKTSEGLVEAVEALLGDELQGTFSSQVGYLLSKRAFRRFRRRVDYSEYGGAALLGVAGLVIVGHGRSSARGGAQRRCDGVSVRDRATSSPKSSRGSAKPLLFDTEDSRRVIAFIFPGQGSQRVGMGQALVEAFPEARAAFEEADRAFADGSSRPLRSARSASRGPRIDWR